MAGMVVRRQWRCGRKRVGGRGVEGGSGFYSGGGEVGLEEENRHWQSRDARATSWRSSTRAAKAAAGDDAGGVGQKGKEGGKGLGPLPKREKKEGEGEQLLLPLLDGCGVFVGCAKRGDGEDAKGRWRRWIVRRELNHGRGSIGVARSRWGHRRGRTLSASSASARKKTRARGERPGLEGKK
uniref:Uncharacterized protein n=1 Tax=Oryza sativa subsp. japonica TaxID=39947 RepID=Q8GS30_ORYSJ|nr:hypothetical protein [Oryza sativa Japonica Group]BAD30253.1 hypothetical protein [Oryza sativa Japonica Group]